jgi:hypothetical protein
MIPSPRDVGWSADGEDRLRRRIVSLWALMWGFLFGALLALIASYWIHWLLAIFAACLASAVLCLWSLAEAQNKLGWEALQTPRGVQPGHGMLANKPRSTANLTPWTFHAVNDPGFFTCRCGIWHFWNKAQWIPNFSPETLQHLDPEDVAQFDSGAGRFVILCGCGQGHYKFRAEPAREKIEREDETVY